METGIAESESVSKMTQRITDIAEILAILNDTNRSKDWLLQEIKKPASRPAFVFVESLVQFGAKQ